MSSMTKGPRKKTKMGPQKPKPDKIKNERTKRAKRGQKTRELGEGGRMEGANTAENSDMAIVHRARTRAAAKLAQASIIVAGASTAPRPPEDPEGRTNESHGPVKSF